ncbi:hypothetical protein KAJ41_01220 [Candidatus Parcubacteria bacterium]|nr:hypothetical protein [Candidatus Parcubacteria bacterium]
MSNASMTSKLSFNYGKKRLILTLSFYWYSSITNTKTIQENQESLKKIENEFSKEGWYTIERENNTYKGDDGRLESLHCQKLTIETRTVFI